MFGPNVASRYKPVTAKYKLTEKRIIVRRSSQGMFGELTGRPIKNRLYIK